MSIILFEMIMSVSFPVYMKRIILNQPDSLAGRHNAQIRHKRCGLFHEALHSSSVDKEQIRFLQQPHILGCQLIIMNTAAVILRQVADGHSPGPLRQIPREQINRIKGSHNQKILFLLRRRPGQSDHTGAYRLNHQKHCQ